MTRKDELALRAARWLQHRGDVPLSVLLEQVEREVLDRVKNRYHCHEYMSDHRTFDEWLKSQQQELG